MQNQKGISTLIGIIIIIAAVIILFGGVLTYQYSANQKLSNQSNQNQQQQTNTPSEPEQNNNSQNNNQPISEIVGGACSYYVIGGSCKIVSIVKTPESIQQNAATGYEGFDVRFTFTPKSSVVIPEDVNKILISQKSPYPLQLTNSWYPGSLYLAKYNIKENNIFDCQALIISKGTCSPVIFKFSNINLSDYFETN